jgi:hypothetical protein
VNLETGGGTGGAWKVRGALDCAATLTASGARKASSIGYSNNGQWVGGEGAERSNSEKDVHARGQSGRQRFGAGDRVGILLDMDTDPHEVHFLHNGKLMHNQTLLSGGKPGGSGAYQLPVVNHQVHLPLIIKQNYCYIIITVTVTITITITGHQVCGSLTLRFFPTSKHQTHTKRTPPPPPAAKVRVCVTLQHHTDHVQLIKDARPQELPQGW